MRGSSTVPQNGAAAASGPAVGCFRAVARWLCRRGAMALGCVVLLLLAGCAPPSVDRGKADLTRELRESFLADNDRPEPVSIPRPEPVGLREIDAAAGKKRVYPARDAVVRARTRTARNEPAGGGIRINFENTDLREVVRVIMTDALHLNYVMDPRVQGSVTVATSSPLAKDELLATLETLLRMNGAALISDQSGYRIVPIGELQGQTTIEPLGGGVEALPTGYGITIVPLRYISVGSILELLGPAKDLPGQVRADPQRNVLIVAGTSAERNQIVALVNQFDLDWLKGTSVGVFPLKNANVDEVIAELQAIFGEKERTSTDSGQGAAAPGGGNAPAVAAPAASSANAPMSSLVKFLAVRRLNAIMVVTYRTQLLREAETWIARLDQGSATGLNLYVYYPENAKATDLANILNAAIGTGPTQQGGPAGGLAPGRRPGTLSQGGAGFGGGLSGNPGGLLGGTAGLSGGSLLSGGLSGGQASIAGPAGASAAARTVAAGEIRAIAGGGGVVGAADRR